MDLSLPFRSKNLENFDDEVKSKKEANKWTELGLEELLGKHMK
jgi:hypothetical protein